MENFGFAVSFKVYIIMCLRQNKNILSQSFWNIKWIGLPRKNENEMDWNMSTLKENQNISEAFQRLEKLSILRENKRIEKVLCKKKRFQQTSREARLSEKPNKGFSFKRMRLYRIMQDQ